MAGKKAKPRKTAKKTDIENLKPSDVLCPICRTILIEPVTLPCNHAFCKLCFEGTMENANLVCPLCRVRVGSWFRNIKKEGKLIDERLWKAIQEQYPTEVQNRYQGIDNVIEADVPIIVVATPGEIRKEYEQERQRELAEQKKIREAEEKASAPLIKKLAEEEEHRRREEEEKLRLDAALAKKLAEDLERPSTSKITPKKVPENKKIDSGRKYGPMDKFIKTEDTKSSRWSLNEERKKLYKSNRRRISITPNPNSDFATKEYTCHVLNAESRPVEKVNPYSIFNNRASYNKPLYGGGMVQKKIRQAHKIIETEERKSICKSGYKSSGSGSDDAIDQECKFYFKPIDTQKRHHLPGTIPLKIPSLKGRGAPNVYIEPPTGKIINLQLGTVISAFARFTKALQENPQSESPPSHEVIEDETSGRRACSSKRLKRKMSDEDGPVRRKGRRQIYTKKNFQYINKAETISSPFYGFDNESSRIVNSSPFYGFDTLAIKESIRERNVMKKLIAAREQGGIDDKFVISTERFYKSFKTYSRHPNKQPKVSRSTSSDVKLTKEPLKLQIPRTPKNGITMAETIKNKLAELRSSGDGPGDLNNKDHQLKINTIDINRNIPKVRQKPSINSSDTVNHIRGSLDSNSTRTSLESVTNSEDVAAKESTVGSKIKNNCLNYAKLCSRTLHVELLSTSLVDIIAHDKDKAKSTTSPRKARSWGSVDTDSKTSLASSKLNTSSSPVNGSWKTRQRNGGPRKAQNNLGREDTEADSLVPNRISPTLNTVPVASASIDLDTASRSQKSDDVSSHFDNKTYHAKTRNVVFLNTNSKITDTFSKTKSSPPRSKNTVKKLKLCPSKAKLNNNIDVDVRSLRVNGEIDIDQRQMQEESDYEMAKKLQARYDAIQLPSRTRRGTKRQITLDEMLSV